MDAELRERLAEDPEKGFEELVRAYQHRLFAFAFAMCANPADAEEIAQDAFVRAHRALRRYEPERVRALSLNAWLHRIALNVFRNRVRRRSGRLVPMDSALDVADGSPGPERQALVRLELSELASEVSRLSEPHRKAVVLRCVQGLDYAEAASLLGLPEATVRSNVHRGLAALRRRRELSEVS
jgi:RNA polymerase sigma-70 factor (ECF subfamily)